MKILKILGIAAGVHALALILLLSSPGCSNSKAAAPESSPISSAPAADAPASPPAGAITVPDNVGIRYSPTRPGTTVASALETQPVSDVVPATTYTVGSGDSLSSIAKRNHLSKADLAAANNLRLTTVLHVGQKLVIPSKAGQAPAPAAAPAKAAEPAAADKPAADSTRHTVKAGETLGGIARKYGVKQGDVAVANNITDPRKIQPGQELIIPARSAASAGKQARAAAPKAPAADEDLDAGLKPPSAAEVPVVKIDDAAPAQPKNP